MLVSAGEMAARAAVTTDALIELSASRLPVTLLKIAMSPDTETVGPATMAPDGTPLSRTVAPVAPPTPLNDAKFPDTTATVGPLTTGAKAPLSAPAVSVVPVAKPGLLIDGGSYPSTLKLRMSDPGTFSTNGPAAGALKPDSEMTAFSIGAPNIVPTLAGIGRSMFN